MRDGVSSPSACAACSTESFSIIHGPLLALGAPGFNEGLEGLEFFLLAQFPLVGFLFLRHFSLHMDDEAHYRLHRYFGQQSSTGRVAVCALLSHRMCAFLLAVG